MVEPKFETYVQKIKFQVLEATARAYWDGTLKETRKQFPKLISPGPKPIARCCIYKEREIIVERIDLALGGDKSNPNILEVIETACGQCPFGGMKVTDLCRGCMAHRCEAACRLHAITIDEHHLAHIDKSKCVNCGLCQKACQFGAIVNRIRPCEGACKIKAITEREDGIAQIDNEKCTRCGQCSAACPFGAIMDKSFLTDCIDILKGSENNTKYNTYICLAPALMAQTKVVKLGQVVTALKKLGFANVVETALGADIVAYSEAEDLAKEGFATSSCCPAFVRYVQTAFPTVADKVSKNLSPMAALGKMIKLKDPTAKVVFVGPCMAKKMEWKETQAAQYIDCVLNYEEIVALINSRDIEVDKMEETPLEDASYFGRVFGRSGGLTEAAAQALKEQGSDFEIKPVKVSGLDQCRAALNLIKVGRFQGNFLEGMACPNGCIGGPSALVKDAKDAMVIDTFGKQSSIPSIKAGLDEKGIDPSIAKTE